MTDEFTDENRWPILRLVSRYGRPFAHLSLAGLLIRLLWIVPRQAGPALVGLVFDSVLTDTRPFTLPFVPTDALPQTPVGQLVMTVTLLLGLTLLGQTLSWLRSLAWGAFAYRLQDAVRTDTYETIQRLDMAFFDDHQTGEIMSVLNNDVDAMEQFFTETIDTATNAVSFVTGVAFYMLLLNWQFALVSLAVIPVIVVVNYYFSQTIGPLYRALRSKQGQLNAQFRDSISGIDVVKAYTAESFERSRVADASRAVADTRVETVDAEAKFYPAVRGFTGVGVIVTFAVGSFWVTQGPPGPFTLPMTAGTLVTFVVYVRQVSYPLRGVSQVIGSYENARASAQRLLGVRSTSQSVTEPADPTDLSNPTGRVVYDGVSFGYEDGPEKTIDDVTLTVEPGETVGLVGATGAGKSTLLKLLVRFYDPDEGSVSLDGIDIRDLSVEDLRSHVGYISQEPFLFSGTVRENVTYGVDSAETTAVWDALDRVEAAEFVRSLPEELDTQVGERGVRLSGGQRQRLALARTVLQDPSVLLLDEATSHVDNETEALIQRSIADLIENRTALVVAHRLSTVTDADRIVVLDDGRVAERGTHEGLLGEQGIYARLWSIQVNDVNALPSSVRERLGAERNSPDST